MPVGREPVRPLIHSLALLCTQPPSTSYMMGGVLGAGERPPPCPHQASLPEVGTVPAGVQGNGMPGMWEGSGGLPDDAGRGKHVQGPLRGPAWGPAPGRTLCPLS